MRVAWAAIQAKTKMAAAWLVMATSLAAAASGQVSLGQPGAAPGAGDGAEDAGGRTRTVSADRAVEPFELLLVHLDDPSYAARQEASARLLDQAFSIEQIQQGLSRRDLSPEQRHRLLAVYSERVLNIPRGALGITMTFARPVVAGQPGEVVINSLLPGLPAERVLQRGDRIGRIDGSPLLSNTDLLRQIQSKRPGDEVVMTVRRIRRDKEGVPVVDEALQPVYEELTVMVALCSAELLDQFETGSQRGPNIVQQARQKQIADARRNFAGRPRLIEFEKE